MLVSRSFDRVTVKRFRVTPEMVQLGKGLRPPCCLLADPHLTQSLNLVCVILLKDCPWLNVSPGSTLAGDLKVKRLQS